MYWVCIYALLGIHYMRDLVLCTAFTIDVCTWVYVCLREIYEGCNFVLHANCKCAC